MKVQALRETGSIDLRMENDLLRAELGEHKQFISQFKRIADGIPTTKSAKRVMSKQGADTAIAQLLGLASTSSVDSSWQAGYVNECMIRLGCVFASQYSSVLIWIGLGWVLGFGLGCSCLALPST